MYAFKLNVCISPGTEAQKQTFYKPMLICTWLHFNLFI